MTFTQNYLHPHHGLPSRQLVGFSAADEVLVGEVIDDHLTAVINRINN